jgi:hypothetical protein
MVYDVSALTAISGWVRTYAKKKKNVPPPFIYICSTATWIFTSARKSGPAALGQANDIDMTTSSDTPHLPHLL